MGMHANMPIYHLHLRRPRTTRGRRSSMTRASSRPMCALPRYIYIYMTYTYDPCFVKAYVRAAKACDGLEMSSSYLPS